MITPSFSLTATERVLPKLALDFTTASLDSRVTFTRTTDATHPATYVDATGVLVSATNNQPRFDYNHVTLACKGLLIEESRTNLSSTSNVFSTWAISPVGGASFVANSTTSPDNTNNGWKLTESNTLSGHSAHRTFSGLTASTAYTYSIYAKTDGSGRRLSGYPSGGATGNFRVNLTTGAVESGSAVVTNAGNGWWRISSVYTTNAGSTSCLVWLSLYNGAGSYQGDGISGAYVFGEQFELGAFATSYIPTTSAALTRNADVATMTGTNFSDWWQATRGGVLVRALPSTVSGIRPLIQFDDNTADNIIALRGNTTNPELYIVDGGTPQAQIDAGTIAANTAYSLTGWWQTNFCAARQGSGARVEDLTATIPTVTQARLGSDGTNYLNGHLATINYYDQFSSQIYTRRKNKVIFTVI